MNKKTLITFFILFLCCMISVGCNSNSTKWYPGLVDYGTPQFQHDIDASIQNKPSMSHKILYRSFMNDLRHGDTDAYLFIKILGKEQEAIKEMLYNTTNEELHNSSYLFEHFAKIDALESLLKAYENESNEQRKVIYGRIIQSMKTADDIYSKIQGEMDLLYLVLQSNNPDMINDCLDMNIMPESIDSVSFEQLLMMKIAVTKNRKVKCALARILFERNDYVYYYRAIPIIFDAYWDNIDRKINYQFLADKLNSDALPNNFKTLLCDKKMPYLEKQKKFWIYWEQWLSGNGTKDK